MEIFSVVSKIMICTELRLFYIQVVIMIINTDPHILIKLMLFFLTTCWLHIQIQINPGSIQQPNFLNKNFLYTVTIQNKTTCAYSYFSLPFLIHNRHWHIHLYSINWAYIRKQNNFQNYIIIAWTIFH